MHRNFLGWKKIQNHLKSIETSIETKLKSIETKLISTKTLSYQKMFFSVEKENQLTVDHPEVPRPGTQEIWTLKSRPKFFGGGGPH